jgi:PAS domain S-box-containing protein
MKLNLTAQDFLEQVTYFFNEIGTEYPGMNFKVKDFMRTDSKVLSGGAKLSDAIKIIVENNIDTVPIVDDRSALIGVITQKMALRAINRGCSLDTCVRNVMKTNPEATSPQENSLPLLRIPIGSIPVVENGRVAGLVTLTDTVRACFSSLLMLHEELQAVLKSVHSGIISVDKDLRIQIINPAGERMLKLSSKDVLGQPVPNIFLVLKMKEAMDSGQTAFGDKFLFHDRILITNISPLKHKNETVGAVAIIQDISDFENISEELKYTKELKGELDTIIESSFDGIYLTDKFGKILRMNDAFVRITGIKKEELIHKTLKELFESGLFNQDVPLLDILKGEPITISQEVITGKTILVTSNPIPDNQNNIIRIVHNVRDITELDRLKKMLQKAQNESQHYKEQLQIMKSNKYIAKAQKSKDLVQLVMNLSKIDVTVLLLGETGVGKDVIAEMFHENSLRKENPIISINCAAIPETLMESELFGYQPGAFTGASRRGKIGAFEAANGGTLFLDEIGEMPLSLQPKLLRAIQKGEIMRLGSTQPVKVDVRIIAATNRDLLDMVERNTFRKDLYYRLNVVPITIPPLRERKEEIPDLVLHFTQLFNKKYKFHKRFDERAFPTFLSYDWPGNVRELENVVERSMITCPDEVLYTIDFHHVHDDKPRSVTTLESSYPLFVSDPNYKQTVNNFEKEMILQALQKCGTTRKAADALGISQSALVRKAAKYNLKSRRVTKAAAAS